jgi:hypothetical protein
MASQTVHLVPLLGVIGIGIVVYFIINPYQGDKYARHPLPPGPIGLPLLGNINDMPSYRHVGM